MPETETLLERIAALLAEATPEAAIQLRDIADTVTDKETRKAARRALYRLSQSGIVPPERAPAPVPQRASVPAPLHAYASAFDGAGHRLLMFLLPDPDGGSPTLVQVLISDEEGVKDFFDQRLPRRKVAERIALYEQKLEDGVAVAEIEVDYGRWLLAQAHDINRHIGRATPPGFLEGLPRIGEPQEHYSESLVWTAISPEAVRLDLSIARDPADLFALRWFEPWFLAVEEVLPWLETWEQVEKSVVITSPWAKQERQDRILREVANAVMPPERRARYKGRLEESADILRRRGKEADARQALFHALALADNRADADIPFVRVLIERTFEAAHAIVHGESEQAKQ